MLKKLRIEFVIFSMVIVTIMLAVIFSLLYISTERNLERESMNMMERIALNPMQLSRPNIPQGDVQLPYFSILLDRNGEMLGIGGGYFDLSDESALENLLQAARESGDSEGVLKSYHLRFSRMETPMGECIVFADTSSEQSTLRNLIKTFILIGGAGYLVFLGISILLAHWAVRPVEKAWLQQKQFVADASHELKTPLTVIMTDAELLNSPDCLPEDRRQFTGNILTMSKQMRGLVESLLELARLDNGSRKTVYANLCLSDAVSAAAMMFEPVFFEKELPFRYEIDPAIPVNGNEAQLRQLTEILLDNASKYVSPGGETRLRLQALSHKRCILEVANQGEPISEEDLGNLFKRFYRADKARTMNHSYGLGLSIAQSIVEEHQGKISAKSEGGWNRFAVELPTKSSDSS